MTLISRWIVKRNALIRLIFLAVILPGQLALTLGELPRLGTGRYLRECRLGIKTAFNEAAGRA